MEKGPFYYSHLNDSYTSKILPLIGINDKQATFPLVVGFVCNAARFARWTVCTVIVTFKMCDKPFKSCKPGGCKDVDW